MSFFPPGSPKNAVEKGSTNSATEDRRFERPKPGPWAALRGAAESRYAMVAGLILSIYLCAVRIPLSSAALFQSVRDFVFASYGNSKTLIYNNVNERPFEACASEQQQRAELFSTVEREFDPIRKRGRNEIPKIISLVSLYNKEATQFYRSPCRAGWSRWFNFFDYAYSFAGATPYIWAFRVFRLTEIYPCLFFIVGAYIGSISAFLIGKSILRSNFGGLLVLAGIEFAFHYIPRSGNDVLYAMISFPLMLGGLLSVQQLHAKEEPIISWRFIAGLVLFGTFSVLSLFALPIVIKLYASVVALSAAFAALPGTGEVNAVRRYFPQRPSIPRPRESAIRMLVARSVWFVTGLRRSRKIDLVRAGLLIVTLIVCRFSYSHFAGRLLQPVSALDTAQSEEFTPVTMIGYTFERPNYPGFLIGDANYFWILRRDPLLLNAPVVNLFHSFRPWSNFYWIQTLLHRPWVIPLNWWGRLFEAIAFHRFFSSAMYTAKPAITMAIYWFGLTVFALALISTQGRALTWPILGVCFFELFGVTVLQGMFHTHALYYVRGVALMWTFLPLMIVLICLRLPSMFSGGRRFLSWVGSSIRQNMFQGFCAAAVAAAVIVALGWVLVREAQREIVVYRIWTSINYGLFVPESYRTHDWLREQLQELESLGSFEPGAVSMYAANVMYFQYVGRVYHNGYLKGKLPINFDAEAEKCRISMREYFRRALKESPDNPNVYQHAAVFELPEWVEVYEAALKRFPHHPYRAMLLSDLANTGHASGRALADALGEFYADTARYRPGFQRLPHATGPTPVSAAATPEGMHIQLLPNQELWLDPLNTYGSDRFKLALYVRIASGRAQLCVATFRGCRSVPAALTPGAAPLYKIAETGLLESDETSARVILKAGNDGADLVLRDLYPLLENPRFYN